MELNQIKYDKCIIIIVINFYSMTNKFGMTSFIDDLVNLQISNSFAPLMKSTD